MNTRLIDSKLEELKKILFSPDAKGLNLEFKGSLLESLQEKKEDDKYSPNEQLKTLHDSITNTTDEKNYTQNIQKAFADYSEALNTQLNKKVEDEKLQGNEAEALKKETANKIENVRKAIENEYLTKLQKQQVIENVDVKEKPREAKTGTDATPSPNSPNNTTPSADAKKQPKVETFTQGGLTYTCRDVPANEKQPAHVAVTFTRTGRLRSASVIKDYAAAMTHLKEKKGSDLIEITKLPGSRSHTRWSWISPINNIYDECEAIHKAAKQAGVKVQLSEECRRQLAGDNPGLNINKLDAILEKGTAKDSKVEFRAIPNPNGVVAPTPPAISSDPEVNNDGVVRKTPMPGKGW